MLTSKWKKAKCKRCGKAFELTPIEVRHYGKALPELCRVCVKHQEGCPEPGGEPAVVVKRAVGF